MRSDFENIFASMFAGLNGDAESGIFGPNTHRIETEWELPTTVSSADEDKLYWSLYQAVEDLAEAIQWDPVAKWALESGEISSIGQLQEWLQVNNDPGSALASLDTKSLVKGLSTLRQQLSSSPGGLISAECLTILSAALKAAEDLNAQPEVGVLELGFTKVSGQWDDLQDLLSEVKAAEEEYRERVTKAISELQLSLGAEYGFEAVEKDGINMLVQGEKSIVVAGKVVDSDADADAEAEAEAEMSDELFDEYVS